MGQSQSDTAAIDDTTSNHIPPPSSMDSLIAEAVAYADDENASVDVKAAKALECPRIADLRKGPCGNQFSEAFLCFLKSSAEEKGSDCVNPFVALQNCVKANPNAFPKDVDEDEEVSEKKGPQKIIPPTWSLESQIPKPKL
ncbi:mitochondrial intermembrane space import and assembly protein 40 homolog [Silene latifolia]|uniref:mitochondrial intermembrane space import and assembly protein 40 homolog n=1 Tax=Silene latifolia TaxID=37657 RepID=UPI003D779549